MRGKKNYKRKKEEKICDELMAERERKKIQLTDQTFRSLRSKL